MEFGTWVKIVILMIGRPAEGMALYEEGKDALMMHANSLYYFHKYSLSLFVSWCHSLLFFPLSFLYQFPLKLTSVFVLLIHGYCSSSYTQTRMSIFFTSLPSFILTLLSAVDTQLPIALPTLRIGHPAKEPWFWPYDRQLSHSCVNISLL